MLMYFFGVNFQDMEPEREETITFRDGNKYIVQHYLVYKGGKTYISANGEDFQVFVHDYPKMKNAELAWFAIKNSKNCHIGEVFPPFEYGGWNGVSLAVIQQGKSLRTFLENNKNKLFDVDVLDKTGCIKHPRYTKI